MKERQTAMCLAFLSNQNIQNYLPTTLTKTTPPNIQDCPNVSLSSGCRACCDVRFLRTGGPSAKERPSCSVAPNGAGATCHWQVSRQFHLPGCFIQLSGPGLKQGKVDLFTASKWVASVDGSRSKRGFSSLLGDRAK